MSIPIHEPVVFTDGGPWAEHDVACSICGERKAILVLNTGRYRPCRPCQREGWTTIKLPRWFRWLFGSWGGWIERHQA